MEIVHADLTSPAALKEALVDIELVVHVAGITKARTQAEYYCGNVETTRALLSAAASRPTIRRFLHMSSLTVVGPSADGRLLDETSDCRPITAYGRSKLEAERLVRDTPLPFPVTILRPPAVYGPRDTDILELFRWVNYGFRPLLGGHEKNVSLIYGPELARAICDTLESSVAEGKTYHVADDAPYQFDELLQQVARIEGKRTVPLLLPRSVVYAVAGISQGIAALFHAPAILNVEKARDLLQAHWVCDASKIKREIGFSPEIKVPTGLQLTWDWYRKQRWL